MTTELLKRVWRWRDGKLVYFWQKWCRQSPWIRLISAWRDSGWRRLWLSRNGWSYDRSGVRAATRNACSAAAPCNGARSVQMHVFALEKGHGQFVNFDGFNEALEIFVGDWKLDLTTPSVLKILLRSVTLAFPELCRQSVKLEEFLDGLSIR